MDSTILDPLDRELRAAPLAAELVLGRDNYCLNYTRAYRAGLFNGSGAKASCAQEQAHSTDKAPLAIVGGTRPRSILI